jgi:branched-chain amino acid transport system ATP-binding protein
MSLLSLHNIGKRFGGLQALAEVSFDVQRAQIVGIMGANGAGKTTLFSLIAGNNTPSTGSIRFDGHPLTGLRPDQICRLGVARTFQIVRPFAGLTVLENLRTAAFFGRASCHSSAEADKRNRVILREVGLEPMIDHLASTLTLSNQKRLEVARAIATGAELLLLDEVMAGLTPTEVAEMLVTLRRLHAERGLTLLVIEHVMRALMELSDHIVVLDHGRLIAQGPPKAIGEDPQVLAVYFGETRA